MGLEVRIKRIKSWGVKNILNFKKTESEGRERKNRKERDKHRKPRVKGGE